MQSRLERSPGPQGNGIPNIDHDPTGDDGHIEPLILGILDLQARLLGEDKCQTSPVCMRGQARKATLFRQRVEFGVFDRSERVTGRFVLMDSCKVVLVQAHLRGKARHHGDGQVVALGLEGLDGLASAVVPKGVEIVRAEDTTRWSSKENGLGGGESDFEFSNLDLQRYPGGTLYIRGQLLATVVTDGRVVHHLFRLDIQRQVEKCLRLSEI